MQINQFLYNITYYKVTSEQPATFVDKLSVVALWSKIIALMCFIRKQRGKHGFDQLKLTGTASWVNPCPFCRLGKAVQRDSFKS